jgi:hypothetical protein
MILKAIEKGASEERLAKALNLSISSIRQKKSLLEGICPEAVDLLKDRHVPVNTLGKMKQMKPVRQVEVAQLMRAMNKYTISYANSLLAATPSHMLLRAKRPPKGLTSDQLTKMEQESVSLDRDFRAIENDYGADNLDLVLAQGYVGRLLENARVVGYLAQRYPDVLTEFQSIIQRKRAA